MLVCFDERLVMRDLYYPHVGQMNQIVGDRNQIGVWADGSFAWVGDHGWDRRSTYRSGSLVGQSRAVHNGLGLELTMRDAVHYRDDILIRQIRVQNRLDRPRDVRLFVTFDFDLEGSDVGDTVLWDPTLQVLFHYKRNRWFLLGADGIHQYATGRKRFGGAEGTWRDAEDGHLEGHPITQGAVDSTIALLVPLGPGEARDLFVWIVCGTDHASAVAGHRQVAETGPEELLRQIEGYWQSWLAGGRPEVAALPPELKEACHRSLLIVRTQVDEGGAILAANDSDILAFNRDHYSYMWPRDGALVAGALDRAGYPAVTRRFFEFCSRAISPEGCFWHKYNPDGTAGSSWHPWQGAKGVQLPIQEDETGLVLWALGNHFRLHRDLEFVRDLYPSLVRPAAEFMCRYRDDRTGLPQESYDLWEERRGVFTFTVAAVVAGLEAAADLAKAVGDLPGAKRYLTAAAEVRRAMLQHLWMEERQYFLRGVYCRKDGELVPDTTLESSVMGLFLLGVLPVTDPRLEATMRKLEQGLWANTPAGGIARYYNDYYFRVADNPDVAPGNPWIICTLWLARWRIARARTRTELEPGMDLVRWALKQAAPTGVLPEQINPFTGAPLSVAPLTWSHATLVDTLIDLAEKLPGLPER